MTDYEDGYREGHKTGFAIGYDDGKASGYVDAKNRAYQALESLPAAPSKQAIQDAFRRNLGAA